MRNRVTSGELRACATYGTSTGAANAGPREVPLYMARRGEKRRAKFRMGVQF